MFCLFEGLAARRASLYLGQRLCTSKKGSMKRLTSWLVFFALCAVPVSLSADTLETVYFRGNMSPAKEIPAVTNESAAATGKATIAVHARRADDGTLLSAVVDFDVDYNFPVPVTVRGQVLPDSAAEGNGTAPSQTA